MITLWLLAHDFTQHPYRQRDLLILVHHGNDLDKRSRYPAGEHIEGDKGTDRYRSVEYVESAKTDDGHAHQLFGEPRHRLCGGRDLFDPKAHRDRLRGAVIPDPLLQRLNG